MSRITLLSLSLLLAALFVVPAAAQKKPVAKKPAATTKKSTTATQPAIVPPLEVRAAREKVDNQLSNVKRFVVVLGPIAQNIEDFEAQAKTKAPAAAAATANESNKKGVVTAIGNLRQGLSDLESEFRTKPALQKYLPTIQGITDLAAQSEDSAIAGKFVASKEPLRQVSQKLTDTLALLPR